MSIERKKERTKKLAESDQYIPGIYNYCDRWCERCVLRSRCFSFAMDPELHTEDSPRSDPDNESFWQEISESFELAAELLRESAEQWGIDLSAASDEAIAERERRRERLMESDSLLKDAEAYADAVSEWMESRQDLFADKAKRIEREFEMNLPGYNPLPDAIDLNDAIEVILWYQYFIYPKISRAMMGLLDDDCDMLDDVNGSAKIALIAMERSIGAWQTLGKKLARPDDVLDLLVQLARMKTELEQRIPDAMAFRRPGFDD